MKRYHVWKAVKNLGSGVFGSLVVKPHENFHIKYLPKKYIAPKIGKIFAFSNLSSAKHFSRHYSHKQIWECLTTSKPMNCLLYLLDHFYVDNDDLLKEYWEDYFPSPTSHANFFYFDMPPPSNTVLCDDLKLWERIQ